MAIGIKSLLTPLDKASVAKDFYIILGLLIGYPVAFQDGEITPAIIDAVIALIVDKLWNPLVLPALQAVYLDYSFGDWLSLIAWLVYNRPRINAQAGTTTLVVENTGGAFAGTIAVGQIRVRSTVSGKTYTNTTSGTIAAYVSGSYPIPPAVLAAYQVALVFEADEAGTASDAQPGDLSTAPVSAPSGLRIQTNTGPILGSDAETDPNLVKRARAAVASLSPGGPRDAYYDAATDPIGAFTRRNLIPPTSWGTFNPAILRVRIQDTGNATVLVSLASDSGPAGGTSTTPDTDVFKANVAIQMFVVPPGITATVAPAAGQNLSLGTITLSVSAESRVTAEEAIATATAALDAFISTLPIGGTRKIAGGQGWLYKNKVFGVLEGGPGDITADVPALSADVAVGGNSVIVLSPAYTMVCNVVPQGV